MVSELSNPVRLTVSSGSSESPAKNATTNPCSASPPLFVIDADMVILLPGDTWSSDRVNPVTFSSGPTAPSLTHCPLKVSIILC